MSAALACALVPVAVQARADADCMPSLRVTDAELAVDWPRGLSAAQCAVLHGWLQTAAQAVAGVHGVFPCPDCRVRIHRRDGARGPVPFGRVRRGQPTVVEFHVDPAHAPERFRDDWVAVHEFSHLLIPFPGNRDIWFAEGLATYYQNVLRARVGLLTPEQAWQKLHEGFQRGRADRRYAHLPLQQLSPRMWSTASYMRVYWSGAAYFLNADVMLRRASGGEQSLDTVLSDFHDCCRNTAQDWNARSLAARFDRLSETDIFSSLLESTLTATDVPAVSESWRWLGVHERSGRLAIDPAREFQKRRCAVVCASG